MFFDRQYSTVDGAFLYIDIGNVKAARCCANSVPELHVPYVIDGLSAPRFWCDRLH